MNKIIVIPTRKKGAGLSPNIVRRDVTVEMTKFPRIILIVISMLPPAVYRKS